MDRDWFRTSPWPGRNRYDGIRAKFIPSNTEALYSNEVQAEIGDILRKMIARGLKFDPQGIASVPNHTYNGEIIFRASKAISPTLFNFLGVWLQAKPGRKIQIKFGANEVEAETVREAKELLKAQAR